MLDQVAKFNKKLNNKLYIVWRKGSVKRKMFEEILNIKWGREKKFRDFVCLLNRFAKYDKCWEGWVERS